MLVLNVCVWRCKVVMVWLVYRHLLYSTVVQACVEVSSLDQFQKRLPNNALLDTCQMSPYHTILLLVF